MFSNIRNMLKNIILIMPLFIGICFANALQGQSQFWEELDKLAPLSRSAVPLEKDIKPDKYRVFQLQYEEYKDLITSAPLENTRRAHRNPLKVEIPGPDGKFTVFNLTRSPIMQAGLAEKYPHFHTFRGVSSDGRKSGRFDITSHGFHGIVFTDGGSYYINPYNLSTTDFYIVFEVENNFSPENSYQIECGVHDHDHEINEYMNNLHSRGEATWRSDDETFPLLTYRLAVAATGEYTIRLGGTVDDGMSAIVTAVNRINSIFERDLGIRFLLVDNNDTLVFTTPGSDGFYTNGNTGQMINQNPPVLNARIGIDNYDIGHVFGTSSSLAGLAGLGNVCSPGKARGVSTHVNPFNDPFIVAIVCHEIGHQFAARHTMYSCHNVNPSTAYEPGSGSTIMSYTGICAPQNNLQNQTDPYFHANSIDVMMDFSRNGSGSACAVEVPTDNIPPAIELSYEDGFHIPIQTPFKLEGIATDENDDQLTISWEQYDIGPSLDPPINLGQTIGNSPLFRVWPPTEDPVRYFPRLSDLINNRQRPYELLPDTTRLLTFRMVVRDNHPDAGATTWEQVRFSSTAQAGPFQVIFPNQRDTLEAGQYFEVLWDVANTDQSPVNSRSVDILLSDDRGFTYPYTLAEGAPNTGSAFVTLPNVTGNNFRVKVRAADNIFFDISDRNFIVSEASEPGIIINYNPYRGLLCLPEKLSVDFQTESLFGFTDTLFFELAEDLPDGAIPIHIPEYVIPGEAFNLEIDFSEAAISGDYRVDFVVFNDTIAEMERSIFFETVSNDFTDLATRFPENGQMNLDRTITFRWDQGSDAEGYEIQVATHPDFSEDVIVYKEVTDRIDSLDALIQFETGEIYYWRIRPFNICGIGEFSDVSAFQVRTRECDNFTSTDVPVSVPANASGTSMLNVELGGEVEEIVVPNVRGIQPFVGDIQLSLLSPSGTEVVLVSGKCGTQGNYDLGFDDDSAFEITPPCSLTSGNLYIPEEPLATFRGEQIEGSWGLRVSRIRSGSAGQLQAWEMSVCFNVTLSEITALRNDTLRLRPESTNEVSRDVLRARSTTSGTNGIEFVLVDLPELGILTREGQELEVGDIFTQNDIDNERVSYATEIDTFDFDHFKFLVRDERNGWRGIERFEIKISDGPATFTEEIHTSELKLTVFPNPGDGLFNYELEGMEGQLVDLTVVSADGQTVLKKPVRLEARNVMDLRSLSSGIYFINIINDSGSANTRVIIE
ncbi:MAG: T9SS C-terminal target domain-containing protein [Saprospirales bacterium]|nr:MAG: T9SS C-terminal target domain-containing protein [Saprospirales bacterium]